MRYSILVYMIQICRTLTEAEVFLGQTHDEALREELISNGRQMLDQIESVLRQHKAAIRDTSILDDLSGIQHQWNQAGQDADLDVALCRFISKLPQVVDCQVRAVFFAELGQKWDSMASVYEFMRDDPRFDPVVVLTPVFRQVQDENGEVKQEVIYEDYLTELGIPFYGYNEYDIAQDCPELAFMCQPYESCTLPQFWAENIAKYTRLVYLPYYLINLIWDSSVETLCQMPVYSSAWKVIGMNKEHLSYYQKYAINGGRNMLLTGLPKTDPLVHLSEKKVTLPVGWEKLQNKKVILWNSWYIYDESSLRFFEEIFSWFERHEDCALIWRPHPMSDIVTKLYMPEKYPGFLEALERVDKAPNMLVDHSESCDMAFFYSDAQISDHSSLIEQYLFMDKPLLWIGPDISQDLRGTLIGREWTEEARDSEDIISFLENIRNGIDKKAGERMETLRQKLPLSDGHCGERVCNTLWDALRNEDGLYSETEVL